MREAQQAPVRRSRRALFLLTALAAVLFFIYSGSAWMWFRPVVHKTIINRYAGQYKIDPLWVMAIVNTESGFAAGARSPRGAVGLMQLLPSTARELADELGASPFSEEALHVPETNLRFGIYYLSKLERMFPQDPIAVLSAYNAGPGVTKQWRQGKPYLDVADIQYGETKQFVRKVEAAYQRLKVIQRWKHLFGIDRGE
jgi:soluble lytic murein transglycosylase